MTATHDELWRAGWTSAAGWPRDDINPPCSECSNRIEHRDAYRVNEREKYEIPGELVGHDHPVPSLKRAHDACLMEGVPS